MAEAARVASPRSGAIRAAALTAVLLLTIVAAVSLQQVMRQSRKADGPQPELLAQRAQTLAARMDGRLSVAGAALNAGREALARNPQDAMGAAELALRTGSPAISAVAVVNDGVVTAQAGATARADWRAADAQAAASGGTRWVGAPGGPLASLVYLSSGALAGAGGPRLIVAFDVGPLAEDAGPIAAVATRQGRLVGVRGPNDVRAASTLQEAFSIPPGQIGQTDVQGRLPGGASARLAIAPVGGGALVAVTAARGAAPAASMNAPLELFTILAPLAIGGALTSLLMWQSRRVQQAHRAFANSEKRFRMAVEAARCGIWEWDLKEDRVFLSEVTGAILGWGGGGIVPGNEVLDRISPEHRDRVRNALKSAAVYGAFDVSFRVPDRAGRPAWIDARGQGLDAAEGGYTRIIGVALDVTEERIAQARVQAAEARLHDAIESVSDAFALWDRQGRLVLCNNAYRTFFSLPPKIVKPGAARDSIGRFVQLAIKQTHPGPEGSRGMREVELNNGRWLQISERRTAEGGLVLTAADITPIKLQDEARRRNEAELQEAVVGLEKSQEQLAELARKYEAEKIRAEGANRAKSEFLANMSHELRTPLNAVNGFSEIMVGELFGPLGDARYKEYAKDILNSGQHLLALINDILDMAKIEAGKLSLKFEPILLEDVAEDAVRLMRNRAEAVGLELSLEMSHLPEVEADYRALKQVLLNLLSNAIKFTPRGGKVTIGARMDSGMLGERVWLSVTDTGIGIAPDDLLRLAQPFEQIESQHSKTQQGTGLGLALTKSLVEMHGGSLEMRSEPGQGTTVSIILPRRQPRAGDATAYAAA